MLKYVTELTDVLETNWKANLMNLRLSSLLLILGGLLLAVGATLGYTPLTEGGVICGSAMSPDNEGRVRR